VSANLNFPCHDWRSLSPLFIYVSLLYDEGMVGNRVSPSDVKPEKDYYQMLGVDPGTNDEATLKKAFRDKAKELHTDLGGKKEEFQELNNAYHILKTPAARQYYDDRRAEHLAREGEDRRREERREQDRQREAAEAQREQARRDAARQEWRENHEKIRQTQEQAEEDLRRAEEISYQRAQAQREGADTKGGSRREGSGAGANSRDWQAAQDAADYEQEVRRTHRMQFGYTQEFAREKRASQPFDLGNFRVNDHLAEMIKKYSQLAERRQQGRVIGRGFYQQRRKWMQDNNYDSKDPHYREILQSIREIGFMLGARRSPEGGNSDPERLQRCLELLTELSVYLDTKDISQEVTQELFQDYEAMQNQPNQEGDEFFTKLEGRFSELQRNRDNSNWERAREILKGLNIDWAIKEGREGDEAQYGEQRQDGSQPTAGEGQQGPPRQETSYATYGSRL